MDRPLELCAGKLSDMTGVGDACLADYEAVPAAEDELAALEAAPWVKSCLATTP